MALSPEVRKHILEAVRNAAEQLEGKLPPHPMHPKGRNPHAHVFERIRTAMGKSYKDCDDWEASRILRIIERCVKYPC